MSRATLLFADRDVEFDDILLNGELGGSTALLGFLASRRGQLMRRLVSVGSDEAAKLRINLAIVAVKEAEALVPQLLLNASRSGEAKQ